MLGPDNNIISGNSITNCALGIQLAGSSYNYVSGNTFSNSGLYVAQSYGNVVVDNLVNGKPLVYLEGASDLKVEDAGQVILIRCNNIRVEDLNVSNTSVGIELWQTNNTIISRNKIKNNTYGILIWDSNYNVFSGNDVISNGIAIFLRDSSNYNVFSKNNITSNEYGILMRGVLMVPHGNAFWHNNFINNAQQVYATAWKRNVWDDGYPFGGNYWSDYSGVDEKSGPNQDKLGSDGIGDTPYVIDEYSCNIDRYPLMGLFGGLTLQGGNATAFPSSNVCLIFENVTAEGLTTVDVTDVGPKPPRGFKLAEKYYDIKTTANYSGTIRIRIVYDDSNMTLEEESSLRLMQWDETLQQWIDITTSLDIENNVIFGETSHLSIFAIVTPLYAPPMVTASIDIDPDTLNLGSKGEWITAYIELPEGYDVSDINVSSILLNETIAAELKPIEIGDYDGDGVSDLMVKFSRAAVTSYILANVDMAKLIEERFMAITLTITGYLNDGTPFQGSATIKIILPMPRCGRFIQYL